MEELGDIRHKLDLALDLDGNVERKLGESDGTACMRSYLGPEHAQDKVREPVDDCRLAVEPRAQS